MSFRFFSFVFSIDDFLQIIISQCPVSANPAADVSLTADSADHASGQIQDFRRLLGCMEFCFHPEIVPHTQQESSTAAAADGSLCCRSRLLRDAMPAHRVL